MAGSNGGGLSPFRRERAYGGLALIAAAILLALIDAFKVDYNVEPFTLFALLGTGATLLGVEAIRKTLDR